VQYLLLITGEQPSEPTSQAEMDQIMGEYWAFDKAVADAGVKVGGEACRAGDRPDVMAAYRVLAPGAHSNGVGRGPGGL
jgi:hypothetical protein